MAVSPDLHVVTGAFGYSGHHIASRLLERGVRVRTLTNSPRRESPLAGRIEVRPLEFGDPAALCDSLRGARVLYNTYWVRFNHTGRDIRFSHQDAVENTLRLFDAARKAGVERLVHISITNPSENSPLEYFRGKAILERALIESGLSHAILRPAVLFGSSDILVNNIAWALRKFPVFGVFGDGRYKLQPIHVADFAQLAIESGASVESGVIDAVGPESYEYRELVRTIAAIIGVRRRIVQVSPSLGLSITRVAGWFVGDVILTREEIAGLMAGLLHTNSPPIGSIRLSDWARSHRDSLGAHYASELARRRNRLHAFTT
ncbi:MAG: NAD(P)H-binding protein [Phycisphaerae bacterium]